MNAEVQRPGFRLPASFWRTFAAERWEAAPLVLRRPFGRPLLTQEELFTALVAASEVYRAEGVRAEVPGGRDTDVRFNVDSARLMVDVEQHLPRASDGTLQRYVERVTRELGGRPFELIVHQLQGHDFELWSRFRDFLCGLFEQIGVPVEKAEAVVFLRNHEATSFGLHRDEASVFLIPVAGRKRILAWPPEAFAGREVAFCTMDYAAHRERAVVLEGKPGDVLYWPSSHWHVGESMEGWSASVSLGVRLRLQPAAEVLRHAMTLLAERLGPTRIHTYAVDPARPQQSVAAQPQPMTDALEALREVCSAPELEQRLRLAWMSRLTACGFQQVPPPLAPRALPDDAVVRGAADPVVSLPLIDGRIACSANGHIVSVAAVPGVTALLERLNDGAARTVGELLDACGGDREVLRRILVRLATVRAMVETREEEGGSDAPECRLEERQAEEQEADQPAAR